MPVADSHMFLAARTVNETTGNGLTHECTRTFRTGQVFAYTRMRAGRAMPLSRLGRCVWSSARKVEAAVVAGLVNRRTASSLAVHDARAPRRRQFTSQGHIGRSGDGDRAPADERLGGG